MLPKINHEQYEKLLDVVMASGHPLLVVGKPGIGKTRALKKYSVKRNADLIISHPATDAPQDIKGYPAKTKIKLHAESDDLEDILINLSTEEEEIDVATFLPFGQMLQILRARKPTIWFFDDFGQAPPSVQAALMQLIGDRELCGKKLPDCVKIVAATNGKEHKANVNYLLEPIKSRFGMIVELMEDLPGFRVWGDNIGLHPNVMLFLEAFPESFCVFKTDLGMENSPNPRLWEKLSDQLYAFEATIVTDDKLREIVACGCVGESHGRQFSAFERVRKVIPTYQEIINDPEEFPINHPVDQRIAILGMLATQGKPNHADAIFTYVKKMAKEYQVVFFRLVKRYNNDLTGTDSAQRWFAANMDIYLD
jgi:hypothetical protein